MEITDLLPDPLAQFQHWLHEAEVESGQRFPNAVALATVDQGGRPAVRIVLLKGADESGFIFFTNYESRKGQDLAANPRAALCFYWDKLGRQVRVEGPVSRLDHAASESYFHTRPRGSQIGAWASPQSQEIPSRSFLDERVKDALTRFEGQEDVPLPPFWGGYCLKPERYEFWQIALNRLHDRFEYQPAGEKWASRRLAP
jgi:pyridoxamine 5'-phosphate oxidase